MAAKTGSERAWLSFAAGGGRFLFPVSEVERVVDCAEQRLCPLPFPSGRICGLINVGGQAAPVLRAALFCGDEHDGDAYILVSAEGERFAFRVSPPLRVVTSAGDSADATVISGASALLAAIEAEHEERSGL